MYTASRKRMPNLERTCMPAHDAITPQIGDPREAFPRFLTTFEHLTTRLPAAASDMHDAQSFLRSSHRLASLLSCIEALLMHAISEPEATMVSEAAAGSSHPLMVQGARSKTAIQVHLVSSSCGEHDHCSLNCRTRSRSQRKKLVCSQCIELSVNHYNSILETGKAAIATRQEILVDFRGALIMSQVIRSNALDDRNSPMGHEKSLGRGVFRMPCRV